MWLFLFYCLFICTFIFYLIHSPHPSTLPSVGVIITKQIVSIVFFFIYKIISSKQRTLRFFPFIYRKERDLLRSSGTIQYENPSRFINCCRWCCLPAIFTSRNLCTDPFSDRTSGVGVDRCEVFRSCLLVVTIICLCIVTGLALHLHSRLDATQQIIDKSKKDFFT